MNPIRSDTSVDTDRNTNSRDSSLTSQLRMMGLALVLVSLVATTPVLAQETSTEGINAFCTSDMALTIKNIFTIIQFGGPLIGGVVALGATVAIPIMVRTDAKRELKEMRNQALVYGVLVAPLGTTIIAFLLNNVVAGGVSCGF